MLVGYEKDLVYMLDLELMELDFGIKVLIFVVCITLLLDLLDEAEEDEADRATEEYDFDVWDIVLGSWCIAVSWASTELRGSSGDEMGLAFKIFFGGCFIGGDSSRGFEFISGLGESFSEGLVSNKKLSTFIASLGIVDVFCSQWGEDLDNGSTEGMGGAMRKVLAIDGAVEWMDEVGADLPEGWLEPLLNKAEMETGGTEDDLVMLSCCFSLLFPGAEAIDLGPVLDRSFGLWTSHVSGDKSTFCIEVTVGFVLLAVVEISVLPTEDIEEVLVV